MTNDQQAPSDFFIGMDRAMVSLGPLSPKRFCTYACSFCYVHSSFGKYPAWSINRIIEWLQSHRANYSIVYVSGDTDSFAKPRTAQGIELLNRLVELDCDVLFTTRAPLDKESVDAISSVNTRLRARGKLLIGCVSISRLVSAPHIEPKPVPSPAVRIQVLGALKEAGLSTVLAVRPFLPIIPASEYCDLVERCKSYADVVLGEAWYFDTGGKLENMVLGHGVRMEDYSVKVMDFDKNGVGWKVWEARESAEVVERHCASLGIPFFMRSAPAIDLLRQRNPSRTGATA